MILINLETQKLTKVLSLEKARVKIIYKKLSKRKHGKTVKVGLCFYIINYANFQVIHGKILCDRLNSRCCFTRF